MTTSTQSLRSTMDSHRQKSTLRRLSVVWPMNDTHEGPVPPGMGRECVDSTRHTTFFSMLASNVRAMMRALRGPPNRGFRDVSSTMAWRSASLGPFGPDCFGHSLDENSRRYLRRTNEICWSGRRNSTRPASGPLRAAAGCGGDYPNSAIDNTNRTKSTCREIGSLR